MSLDHQQIMRAAENRTQDNIWRCDLVTERTSNGKPLRMHNAIDEYTWECLAIRIDQKITSKGVVEALAELFVTR
jgi:putative transposase